MNQQQKRSQKRSPLTKKQKTENKKKDFAVRNRFGTPLITSEPSNTILY